ncbi:glycosyltransferase family 4 protein [Candidatus Oleimmundimicrobium sp.]|uniref:glycosyltransferase family 4 protein n=1 Tax=Candidatus Oleimmundimicrobium sp. TaxID=3060597 RepID=UPI002716D2B9|nr:glycosyltransferase family 4 protein [Candidatus Oleimmundimicrobium sp.]MDO8885719.1 glycosyltransferase family 4 protein [Candidatus Oleimmundimicrobium sp.]
MKNLELGIICYTNLRSGLGIFAKEFIDNLGIDHILSVNSVKGREDWQETQINASMRPNDSQIIELLEKIDLLITLEIPFNFNAYRIAKEMGKKSAVVVNHEWFNLNDNWGDCDLFICPSKTAYDKLGKFGDKRLLINVPIDISGYKFTPRGGLFNSNVFVHNAGYGGIFKRKSTDEVIRAFHKSKAKKLIINAQRDIGDELSFQAREILSEDTRIDFRINDYEDNNELYKEGDIAIQPSKFEGYGRAIIEAMACGMPVITTNQDPMNSFYPDKELLIKTDGAKLNAEGIFNAEVFSIDVCDLTEKINLFSKTNIRNLSHQVRKEAENKFNWTNSNLKETLCRLN